MQIARTLDQVAPAPNGRVLAIGNFDGVHLGHRTVIGAAVERANALGQVATVLTFHPHPVTVLRPDHPHHMLTTFEDKAEQFRLLGVKQVVCLNFDPSFATHTPAQFVATVLAPLAVSEVYVGSGYKFGKDRSGHADTLVELGQQYGFSAFPQDTYSLDGERVSSSRIRRALHHGNVALAATLLGRPYGIKGLVVAGVARGRELGYRTANLDIPEELVPADGVYAARVRLWDQIVPNNPDKPDTPAPPHRAIVYIGTRPTFEEDGRLIEVHLLDEAMNLYGHRIRIGFVDRVRGEMTFADGDALKTQISKDVSQAKAVLGEAT